MILVVKNYSRIHRGAQFRKIIAPHRTENPHQLRRYPNPKSWGHMQRKQTPDAPWNSGNSFKIRIPHTNPRNLEPKYPEKINLFCKMHSLIWPTKHIWLVREPKFYQGLFTRINHSIITAIPAKCQPQSDFQNIILFVKFVFH